MTDRNSDLSPPRPAARVISPRAAGDQTDSAEDRLLRDLQTAAGRPSGRPPLFPLGGLGTYEGEFVVDLAVPMCGRDVRDARTVLKRADPWGVGVHDLTSSLNLTEGDAADYLGRLVRAGLLSGPHGEDERAQEWEHHDYRLWKPTPTGKVLAHASGRKPSSRGRAESLAAAVVTAAEQINASPDDALYWVEEIRALGGLAEPADGPLLHVDLAVTLRPRLADPLEQAKAERRMQDAARDRGERGLVRDMIGYGHWQTRLKLAGHSKTVRLFKAEEDVRERVLFREPRDLTLDAEPTAPYARPADPGPLSHCSWCRQPGPAERVAAPGREYSTSPIGLCQDCLVLGGAAASSAYDFDGGRGTARRIVATLTEQPRHATGCALCGRTAAAPLAWWSDRHGNAAADEPAGVRVRLCQICPGLLHLHDAPTRERWWRSRFGAACMAGMHATLRREAGLPEPEARTVKPPRPARLTQAHQEILTEIRRSGVMTTVDFSRDAHRAGADPHRRWSWWETRIGHLLDHELVALVANDRDTHPQTAVRILADDERDLTRRVFALHVPGPVWDGSRVTEPEPPTGWTDLYTQLTVLRRERDKEAHRVRALARPTDLLTMP
ncbi:hypothetical protein [Actinacidiphila sp. ITFR-21]|uniref:hypothetical protein n=1 Tax=Actinacidiphila sp. ITFR-21 TaxID=3075199 RepID=UPI0028894D7D|nr:hypothetical protein [Streptomyces sp. ITFR-21]WNI19994.1 hypothetical protein RLT57_31120 [Streptomyces sp. ITFR-21]